MFFGFFGCFWFGFFHVGVGGDDVSGHHWSGGNGDKIKNVGEIKKGSFIWHFSSSI